MVCMGFVSIGTDDLKLKCSVYATYSPAVHQALGGESRENRSRASGWRKLVDGALSNRRTADHCWSSKPNSTGLQA